MLSHVLSHVLVPGATVLFCSVPLGVLMLQALGASWQKSSSCRLEGCVEAAATDTGVMVRNSNFPAEPPLRLPAAAWSDFLRGIRKGDFTR